MAKNQPTQHDLDYYSREKINLLSANKKRNDMFAEMDNMAHNVLSLPAELTRIEGFHQVTPTEPSDALQTAKRILSTVEPKITYYPLDNSISTRARADTIERALMWHYNRASKRSVSNLTADIVSSAFRYDEIAAQVVYLPWQNEISSQEKLDKWETSGDYAIIIHNPQDVYVKRTHRGVRTILLYTELSPEDVIDTWGDKAKKIIDNYVGGGKKKIDYPDTVFYCDRWDKTDRVVWLEFSKDAAEIEEKNVIIREPHNLPFIPWVCRAGGSAIDKKPEYQRRPLLTSIFQSKSWTTQAIVESLIVTEAIKTGAAPLTTSKTVNGKSPKIDYTIMGGNIPVGVQESVTPFPKPQIDERLHAIADRIDERMGSSTVPKVLSNPSFSAKAAFAAVNAILHAASNVLDPGRKLSEDALADIFSLELQWLIFKRKPLYAYDFQNKKSDTYGNQIMVDPQEIEPGDIYITVNLTANLPLDKVGEINAVSMLKKEFGISKERALEMLDFTDAESLVEEGVEDALSDAEIQKAIGVIAAEGQAAAKEIMDTQALGTQQKQMDMQSQQQQAQMAQQQQMQQQQPQPGQEQMPPGQDPGQMAMVQQQQQAQSQAGSPDQSASLLASITQNMQGQGFNPAQGGSSPSGSQPGALTREKKKRKTQGGAPIVGA